EGSVEGFPDRAGTPGEPWEAGWGPDVAPHGCSGGLPQRHTQFGGHGEPALEGALVADLGEVRGPAPGDAAVRPARRGDGGRVQVRVEAVLEQRQRLRAQLGDPGLGDAELGG